MSLFSYSISHPNDNENWMERPHTFISQEIPGYKKHELGGNTVLAIELSAKSEIF